MPASPFLYLPGDRLSASELSAARLDGDVVEVGDAYMPADAVETVALRAGSLLAIMGDVLAATNLSAAWIHGAIDDPPARHAAQRAVRRRVTAVVHRRVRVGDTALEPSDLLRVGGVWVTTRRRTLADLCRSQDPAETAGARAMAALFPGLAADARTWLTEQGRIPNKRPALRLLAALAADDQEDVTR
jgi:hypothetical protein